MILIGMLDSPFVRRVAVTLNLLGMPFEHRNWSVGRDFERILEFNPLGRVPTLVIPDGDPLIESSAILDYLDEAAGPARALLPAAGPARRAALRAMAIAIGAAEKGVLQVYEKVFRPAEKFHPPWVARCRLQMHAALAELERLAEASPGEWLTGAHMTQADITATCVFTFLSEAVTIDQPAAYSALSEIAARCEALPQFQAVRAPWFSPGTPAAPTT